MKRDHMIKNNQNYWVPWETIKEGNPQYILDRKEHGTLPPLLIMQGALDDNVLPAIQEKFVGLLARRRRRCEARDLRGLRARVGRQARAADRPGARDGEGRSSRKTSPRCAARQ